MPTMRLIQHTDKLGHILEKTDSPTDPDRRGRLPRVTRKPCRPAGLLRLTLVPLLALTLPSMVAAEEFSPSLLIKAHRFEPAELEVPANVKFKLVVKNLDPTPEEFESYELKREKIIRGNSEITLYLGPLPPGTYPFFGDFHQDSAQGRLIAK